MSMVICIIPARSGSKEIKNKNIFKINGKPLIYYTISFAKKLSFIDKLIFSTDSSSYMTKAKKYYNFKNSLRKKKYSKSTSKAIDYVKHELKKIKNLNQFKYLLLLQPTAPFRKKDIFFRALKMLKDGNCDSVISAKLVKEHPLLMHKYSNRVKYISKNFKSAFTGRQNFPKIYLRQGAMYFTKISTLFKTNSLQGGRLKHILVKGKYALDINDHEDLVLLKSYLKINK
jgi:CMP-N,N'-diacetyllegionaminic acid synthase